MVVRRLRVATIHNGELDSSPALEVVAAVSRWTVAVDDVSEQAAWDPNPDVEELKRWRREQAALELAWADYLGTRPSPIQATLGKILFSLRLRTSSAERANAWRVRQVEIAVADKHIRAWQQFVDSDEDELLVLESDAALTDQAEPAIQALLTHASDRPRYVNLAGGLNTDELGIARWESDRWQGDGRFMAFSKPVTNTSCAYVVNRAMAQVALDHLVAAPKDKSLGIDWVINSAFLAREKDSIECLHALPPVLQHGSMVGLTQSWHPQR